MFKENHTFHLGPRLGSEYLVPPTVPISLNEDGLLPVDSLGSSIIVTFPVWEAVTLHTSYQLLWDKITVGATKLIVEGDLPGHILTLEIPVGALTTGHHSLAYRLVNLENGVHSDSQVTPIQIDRTAPGDPLLAPILFPAAIQDGLTSDELEAMGNVLAGEIAGYQGMREGDVIRTYWGSVEGPVVVVDKDDMGLKRVAVTFPREFLEGIGDIQSAVYYTATDLAGNVSMNAQPVQVSLLLLVLPQLPVPTVREANGNVLDPADAVNGATVLVAASAQLRAGDRVITRWDGPNGSDSKDRVISEAEAGKELALVFSAALVEVNKGQRVAIAYTVNRSNGSEQRSETLLLQILAGQSQLPAPTMDTVGADGILTPANIPESGATVRVRYAGMSTGDRVFASWSGISAYITPEQVVGANVELLFNVPKAYVTQSIGSSASVTYTVTRAGTAGVSAPLFLRVDQGLSFDPSPVTLNGKIYLIPGSPELLPSFPPHTTLRRTASGGLEPYTYRSSDTQVAQVDASGMTSVRGKGAATITVTDARGQTASYPVSVTGVIHCLGVGSGSFAQVSDAAAAKAARIPSIDELNQIFNTFGSQWPMGNGNYWSSTVAAQNLLGMKWYFVKNLVNGANYKLKYHNASLGVAIR